MQKVFEDLEKAVLRLIRKMEKSEPLARHGMGDRQGEKTVPPMSAKNTREAADLVRRALSRLKSL